MKKYLLILMILPLLSFGGKRYWVGGGASANWSATGNTNWSLTSGGAGNAAVPGTSDSVYFDGAGSGNSASTISATITVMRFEITSGYTNTITHNAVLTCSGDFTLNTSYTIAGSSPVTLSGTCTITSGGKTWPNAMTFSGANTKTLSGNLVISGDLTLSTANSIINWTTNETLSCAGLMISGSQAAGTAKIIVTGGILYMNSSGYMAGNNIDIQGNVTIGVNFGFGNSKTLTYVSGTVTTTSSTFYILGSCTLNTAGIAWNNIYVNSDATITNNSLLTVTGTYTMASWNVSWQGNYGFTVGTLVMSSTSNSSALTLNDGVTYTVTTVLQAYLSRKGSIVTITSDDATNKAILTLNQGATCNVLANLTRIDASAGRTIFTFNGTITNCLNVVEMHDRATVGN
jgi:hypothetical protein